VDADTVRLTWSDLPIESQARLAVRITESGRFEMRLVRPRPQQSDAVATDRVLDLDFHVAVPASNVRVTLVDDLLPSTSMGFGRVALQNTTGSESFAAVWDETDSLVGVDSGSPGDGSSVHYDDVRVEDVRENAIQLTWSEMPRDGQTRLSIRRAEDGTYRIRVLRTVSAEGDVSLATDRVLELRFLVAVPASDVEVTLVDTLE
jgi:hypothetical protein